MTKNLKLKTKSCHDNKESLIISEFFVEADDVEKRYKALKKTIKNIKKFNETQIKTGVAEA